ncbi:MAG: DUF2934 domain-containing protein [Gemmataceae bacterium]
MSKTVTPSVTQPTANVVKVPPEKIAARAYEKWCLRGQPHGSATKDWLEAEAELRAEPTRQAGNQGTRR